MLNKTVVVPVLSAAAMAAFTVWALLVGPPDAAHAGERGVAPAAAAAAADSGTTYCAAIPQPKTAGQ